MWSSSASAQWLCRQGPCLVLAGLNRFRASEAPVYQSEEPRACLALTADSHQGMLHPKPAALFLVGHRQYLRLADSHTCLAVACNLGNRYRLGQAN